jgi:phosphohistidine phosphatase
MKRLSLLRHAKSDWHDPSLTDFQRPLNARGRENARAMGREMRALGLAYDCVLASPAARVTETLDAIEESFGALDVRFDERIYLASTETLLTIVREAADAQASLLLVGHNPGMERLALLLSRGGALHDKVAEKYPTGALAEIALPIDHWRSAADGAGTLQRFLRPRDLQD